MKSRASQTHSTNEVDTGMQLGNLICETLSFCYSPEHKRSLEAEAHKMEGTPNLDQLVAAALATRIKERWKLIPRDPTP